MCVRCSAHAVNVCEYGEPIVPEGMVAGEIVIAGHCTAGVVVPDRHLVSERSNGRNTR